MTNLKALAAVAAIASIGGGEFQGDTGVGLKRKEPRVLVPNPDKQARAEAKRQRKAALRLKNRAVQDTPE